jgi:lipoprotein-anchoring transpeptidase ErfK/SrfK
MRQRPVLIITTFLAVLLVACGGVLVADASTPKKIPEGVSIGGVDVGGLTKAAAERKATAELTDRLSKPVRVVHSDEEWNLTAQDAGIKVDLGDAADRAVALGEDGNAFSRVYHRVAGNEVRKDFSPTSTYDRRAITRLLDNVEKDLHREPKSAAVSFEGGDFKVTKGRVGLRLKRERVAQLIRTALLDPNANHQVSAYTSKIQPAETTAAVRKKYSTVLVANRSAFKLTLYKNMKVSKVYGISVGKAGHDTPAGQYTIGNKAENPSWHVPNSAWAGSLAGTVVPPGPSNPIKARWMGIYDGVGIHGTSDDASIGTNASHGCLRMHVPDVIELFDKVPVGTPIYIQ